MTLIPKLQQIVGVQHVLTGADAAPFGRDWTGKYSGQPSCVVQPANTGEVSQVVKLAAATQTPVVPVAGNTGLAGGTYAKDAIMLSVARLNRICEINVSARTARVEAGVVLGALHEAAEEKDLIFPLIFGARGSAMIGGVLSTNAGGSNVLRYGNTRVLCLGLEVVLPSGEVMNLMSALHKDNSGYDLRDLFIGAEGTLGIITGAILKLMPKPNAYATAMVSVPSLVQALSLLNKLQKATGGLVEAFEYMPRTYMERLATCRPDLRPPFEKAYDINILVELGATAPRDVTPDTNGDLPLVRLLEDILAAMFDEGLVLDAVVARSDAQRKEMWQRRELAAEITLSRLPIVDSDIALPLDGIATFLEKIEARLPRLDRGAETITVGHLGDGNLHYAIWPSSDDPALMDRLREAVEDVVAELGGSFSAEHGIGLSKKNTMMRRKDRVALCVMRQIKRAIDPQDIMNPGKMLPEPE